MINIVYAGLLISLPYIPWVYGIGKGLYAVWITFTFLCVGGNFVLGAVGVTRALGPKYFAENYGIVFSAMVSCSFVQLIDNLPILA